MNSIAMDASGGDSGYNGGRVMRNMMSDEDERMRVSDTTNADRKVANADWCAIKRAEVLQDARGEAGKRQGSPSCSKP